MNRNQANVEVAGTVEGYTPESSGEDSGSGSGSGDGEDDSDGPTQTGDVRIAAELTQNTTGDFARYLAAQSLAGAISGEAGKGTVAAAVSVLVSDAETKVRVGNGTKIEGHQIEITSTDKSKLGVRAGGVSISKGTKVCVGASFASIFSNNIVDTTVEDDVSIIGNKLTVTAEKKMVSLEDYVAPFSASDLITDSTDADDEAETGLIDMKKTKDGKGYSVKIEVTGEQMLKAVDLLNFLAYTNYYAEAISGSIITSTGDSSASVAGSVAVISFNNTIHATIGAAKITTTAVASPQGLILPERDGSVTVKAQGDRKSVV